MNLDLNYNIWTKTNITTHSSALIFIIYNHPYWTIEDFYQLRIIFPVQSFQGLRLLKISNQLLTDIWYKPGWILCGLTRLFTSYPCKWSIHLIASASLIFPRYLWVVDKFEWRKSTLLTISSGVPERDAYVAACLLRSCGLTLIFTKSPAFLTTNLAPA